jgi:Hint domain
VVFFGRGNNRLVDHPGAVFVGNVDGGNTLGSTSVSTLELASGTSAGTLVGLGTQFVNFGQVTLDAGAEWTLQFPAPASAQGSVSGFAAGDTLDLANIAPASVTLSSGTLEFTGGGFPLSLTGATGIPAVSDDSGGALVTVACFREGTRIRTPRGDVPVEETIVQAPVEQVIYYHVELARHDVLLAEGLPTESYLDTGHRADFAAGNVVSLHPDLASRTWEAIGCAPLVVSGPKLDAIRASLATNLGSSYNRHDTLHRANRWTPHTYQPSRHWPEPRSVA